MIPVTYLASSDARKRAAFAQSSGSIKFLMGFILAIFFILFASLTFFTRGVSAVPGANAFTVIPYSQTSLANNFVIPRSPAFAAPYGMYDGA